MAEEKKIGLNMSFFTNEASKKPVPVSALDIEPKKKTTKKKETSEEVIINGMANPIPGAIVAETDYARSFSETNNLIRGTIAQADELSDCIKQDIDDVRASKTLKNKYTYITNLTGSASSVLSMKIAAIKELNASIGQVHRLELDRLKALKSDEKDKENDDMRMMDIYSAFVNTPVGVYAPPAPSAADLTVGVNGGSMSSVEMGSGGNYPNGGLTAEQNRMRMESNPNIQVVVRYDQSSGQRAFDVIDRSTGQSIPNYPRPDNFLLEDTTIDIHGGIARNRNINTVWPLLIEGSNSLPINEY